MPTQPAAPPSSAAMRAVFAAKMQAAYPHAQYDPNPLGPTPPPPGAVVAKQYAMVFPNDATMPGSIDQIVLKVGTTMGALNTTHVLWGVREVIAAPPPLLFRFDCFLF